MVLKVYTEQRVATMRPPFNNPYFQDTLDDISTTGILVDDDAYNTGSFLDRDYEVRGMLSGAILLENVGANGIEYTIQETTKHYIDLDADLVNADFVDVTGHTAVVIAGGAKNTSYKLIRLTPDVTAVKLRARRSAGADSTLRADVKFV